MSAMAETTKNRFTGGRRDGLDFLDFLDVLEILDFLEPLDFSEGQYPTGMS